MSLLIKALDHLDKSKQAESSKKQASKYAADEALLLELVPVESEQTLETQQTVEEKVAFSDSAEAAMNENATIGKVLTLEDEAGLSGARLVGSTYPKSKLGTTKTATDKEAGSLKVKPAAQPSTQKNSPQSASATSTKNPTIDQAAASPAFQAVAAEHNQKVAAKVFVANKAVKASSSKSMLIILGVAGALLLWLGLQGYGYIKTLTAHDVVVVKPSMLPAQQQVVETTPAEVAIITPAELPAEPQPAVDDANEDGKTSAAAFSNAVVEKPDTNENVIDTAPKKSRTKKTTNSNDESFADDDEPYNLESASNARRKPVKLISKASSAGIDPALLAAYQAFTRGENAVAQQQYRQVLQRDVRNVDALLGMAAIAQRQGRDADAVGWYQKVLEIEPRNTIAKSAMVNLQANNDIVGTESRIKNMLAQQPDAANLHAALGNLYAEQGQWPSAQQSYFEASRLAPSNADYAFNLAISLDQLGKSGLALKQYQRALELLNESGGSSPDRVQLEDRIRALR
ncbi:MAG: tetratricopeptide repeat protein [Methylotenera sp.]|nr:tetratricopeptide repeat protein [Methylotenera sp.]